MEGLFSTFRGRTSRRTDQFEGQEVWDRKVPKDLPKQFGWEVVRMQGHRAGGERASSWDSRTGDHKQGALALDRAADMALPYTFPNRIDYQDR